MEVCKEQKLHHSARVMVAIVKNQHQRQTLFFFILKVGFYLHVYAACVLVPTEARKTASTPVELELQEVMGHLELRWAPEPDSAQDEEQEGLFLWFDVFLSFHFLFQRGFLRIILAL